MKSSSQTEVFACTIIYAAIGIGLFAPIASDAGINKYVSILLISFYIALGILLARHIIMQHRHAESPFDRAYFFSNRFYSIDKYHITLGPIQKQNDKHTHSEACAINDAIAEFYYNSQGLHKIDLVYPSLPLRITSLYEVPFIFYSCLKYPFTHIDLRGLKIDSKTIDIETSYHPTIREIMLPHDLHSVYFDIANCPNLSKIILPSKEPVKLKFNYTDRSIKNVSPDFTIYVPSKLLTDYQSKYGDIEVQKSDSKKDTLHFAPIPERTEIQ